MQNADGATDEKAETEQEKNSWIEIELVAEDDSLIVAVKYEIETPDGTMVIGTLDKDGFARVEGFSAGEFSQVG